MQDNRCQNTLPLSQCVYVSPSGPFQAFGQLTTIGTQQLHSSAARIKLFQSCKIEFKIQYTAHTKDSYDSDLEAFESNIHALIQAQEECQNSTLVSNPCPNTSETQSV